MKALVYHGPANKAWESADDPGIEDPTDVIVKVDTTTICGTDLHILKGDVPAVTEGRILGHEAVGTVVETGCRGQPAEAGRPGARPRDHLVRALRAVQARAWPRTARRVGGIGWIFGHLIDGVQAEYARVPYAETSVHLVPEGVSDEQVLFLADILPTGYEIGVQNGRVKPGDTVAVVGAGPVGLAAMMTAAIAGAGPDHRGRRRELAARARASSSARRTPCRRRGSAEQEILEITGGRGVDVAMEAVGIPATFDLCTRIVRPGGAVANIGVHGAPTTLHLEELWIKNITITTGLVSGTTIPTLLQARARRADRGREARHAPLRAGRHHGGLRRLRRGRRARRAQGGAHRRLSARRIRLLVTGARELRDVRPFVQPATVALVGASPRRPLPVENAMRGGVRAIGVNPARSEVLGLALRADARGPGRAAGPRDAARRARAARGGVRGGRRARRARDGRARAGERGGRRGRRDRRAGLGARRRAGHRDPGAQLHGRGDRRRGSAAGSGRCPAPSSPGGRAW